MVEMSRPQKHMLKHIAQIIATSLLLVTPVVAAPVIHSVRSAASLPVGLYEKFELRIELEAKYTNPFDPDDIDLWSEFIAPSGKVWKIWGFYNSSPTPSPWMVRFAPTEVGQWQYVVKVRDRTGSAHSQTGAFTAISSAHHGFIGIAPNQRYLMYSDGTSFYGVGLWHNDKYESANQGSITEQSLDQLKKAGGNFISFYSTPLETMTTGVGRYDESRCDRLDQLFEWCENRDIHISWNIWFHAYLSQTVWGDGSSRYRLNPYQSVTDAKGFFGSERAWKFEERLHRYMIARWGYSRALFLWFLIDEINGTDGWAHGDRAVAEQWCRQINVFFGEHDPYHRPTTGTQSGAVDQWWPNGYKIFNIAAREIYEAQGHPIPTSGKLGPNDRSSLWYSYHNYAAQAQNLWSGFQKPLIVGECGFDHTYDEPGTPEYIAMHHNALWVSLATGLCCTPFWWSWSDTLNDSIVTNQLRYLGQFVSDIDLAHLALHPTQVDAGACDAWALKSDRLIFGWMVNPQTSLARESFMISGLKDGDYEVRLYRTWRGLYLEPQTLTCRDGKLTVTIPELQTASSHASNIGHDIAFKIVPK